MRSDQIQPERTVKVSHPRLDNLDAALSFVVQTIEAEGFRLPNVTITAYEPIDPGDTPFYEATVTGESASPHFAASEGATER